MRSLHAILLAGLTIVVITVSVILTASHFGMRDWPTPPMPDTATRLITPTEGAAKARERMSDGRDPAEVQVAADAGADARRDGRATRPATIRRAEPGGRSATRRDSRTGRRSDTRRQSTRSPAGAGDSDSNTVTPAEPSAPQSTPAEPSAPVTQAGSGDGSQARPDQTPPATTTPAPPLVPVVPQLPPTGSGDGDDTSQDPTPGRHGHGRRRGPVGNLLDALP